MKWFMFLTILACCTLPNVHASVESSRQSFWSLVRGDESLDNSHFGAPQAATMSELNRILENNGKATFVMFRAPWCGPCDKVQVDFDARVAATKVSAVIVDVDKNEEAAAKYGIKAMPTYKVLSAVGKEIWSRTGGALPTINEGITVTQKQP